MAALGCASLINKVNLSQNPQLPTNQPLNLTCHAHGQRHLQVHVQRTKFFTGKTHLVVYLTLPVINNGARRHCFSCSALFALCNTRPTPSRASFVPARSALSTRRCSPAQSLNLSCAAMAYTHAPVPMISSGCYSPRSSCASPCTAMRRRGETPRSSTPKTSPPRLRWRSASRPSTCGATCPSA